MPSDRSSSPSPEPESPVDEHGFPLAGPRPEGKTADKRRDKRLDAHLNGELDARRVEKVEAALEDFAAIDGSVERMLARENDIAEIVGASVIRQQLKVAGQHRAADSEDLRVLLELIKRDRERDHLPPLADDDWFVTALRASPNTVDLLLRLYLLPLRAGIYGHPALVLATLDEELNVVEADSQDYEDALVDFAEDEEEGGDLDGTRGGGTEDGGDEGSQLGDGQDRSRAGTSRDGIGPTGDIDQDMEGEDPSESSSSDPLRPPSSTQQSSTSTPPPVISHYIRVSRTPINVYRRLLLQIKGQRPIDAVHIQAKLDLLEKIEAEFAAEAEGDGLGEEDALEYAESEASSEVAQTLYIEDAYIGATIGSTPVGRLHADTKKARAALTAGQSKLFHRELAAGPEAAFIVYKFKHLDHPLVSQSIAHAAPLSGHQLSLSTLRTTRIPSVYSFAIRADESLFL